MKLTRENFRAMIYYDFDVDYQAKNASINLFTILAMKPNSMPL